VFILEIPQKISNNFELKTHNKVYQRKILRTIHGLAGG